MSKMGDVAIYVEEFTASYIETELWSGLDWDGRENEDDCPEPLDDNYGPDEISGKAMEEIRSDCESFVVDNWELLKDMDPGQAGHDFSLTRNHHGAGFWDRGLGAVGDTLTEQSHPYGETDYYTVDGLLYLN